MLLPISMLYVMSKTYAKFSVAMIFLFLTFISTLSLASSTSLISSTYLYISSFTDPFLLSACPSVSSLQTIMNACYFNRLQVNFFYDNYGCFRVDCVVPPAYAFWEEVLPEITKIKG